MKLKIEESHPGELRERLPEVIEHVTALADEHEHNDALCKADQAAREPFDPVLRALYRRAKQHGEHVQSVMWDKIQAVLDEGDHGDTDR